MRPGFARFAAWLCGLLIQPAHADAPRVVASIPPLHSLVAAVMEGVGEPALLLSGEVHVHGGVLRPSQRQLLETAGLVFWIGPGLETALAPVLAEGSSGKRNVAFTDDPSIATHALRAAGVWKPHESVPSGAWRDPHVWLDPAVAGRMTGAIARTMISHDPANAAHYGANADRAVARLERLDREIAAQLSPVTEIPFVVEHDAFQYFERRYGLAVVGAALREPDEPVRAGTLAGLRETIRERGVRCLLAEAGVPERLAVTLGSEQPLDIVRADAMGSDLDPGPDLYPVMMRRLVQGLRECLERTPSGGRDE